MSGPAERGHHAGFVSIEFLLPLAKIWVIILANHVLLSHITSWLVLDWRDSVHNQ